MSNEPIITQSLADSRNRDLATMAEAIRDLCIRESAREPLVPTSIDAWDATAERMVEIRDCFDPPTLTTSCPDCDGRGCLECNCVGVIAVDDLTLTEIPEDATAIPTLSDDEWNIIAEMHGCCIDAIGELEHVPTAAIWIRFGEQFARYVSAKAAEAENKSTEKL